MHDAHSCVPSFVRAWGATKTSVLLPFSISHRNIHVQEVGANSHHVVQLHIYVSSSGWTNVT